MSPEQVEIALALWSGVVYLPGSFDKRFARNISAIASSSPEKELSEKQAEWLFRLLFKYRKQLPELYLKHSKNPLCSRLEKRS